LKHLEELLFYWLVLLLLDVPDLLVYTDYLFYAVIIDCVFAKSLDVFELYVEILLLHEDALFLAEVLD